MERGRVTIDGTEAAAAVAYRLSEVIAIFPITPATPMGEFADTWAAAGLPNLWGAVPSVAEMQSEGGAAGAVHGALQSGALTTTFTASQGLLLMIPNMYKIAGELTPAVIHVTARAIATQGLSIFGDHSDVMAVRATGFAMLASNSVQEAQDMALVAHAATLKARVPFVHFFDGFRTSHEINTIERLGDDDLRALTDPDLIAAHRARALSPERPSIRGTAQNPDVYFQARERANPYYLDCPAVVQEMMDRLAAETGRRYGLYDYCGAPDAERVVVVMGSAAETAEETVQRLCAQGEKVGVVKVRLYRPFALEQFVRTLPAGVQRIAVLDRTKEPGSAGEPLYLDVMAAVNEAVARGVAPFAHAPRIVGGRYGLASKEVTPAMIKAVFDELARPAPRHGFTVGIDDDLTRLSLDVDPTFSIEADETIRCVFWGLGSDGTVGANKDSIKIIGEDPDIYAQGYFVYDSKKSGAVTISHLRFGPTPIRAPYLIERAHFVACHQFSFLERFDVLRHATAGGTFLLNSGYGPDEVWDRLPRDVQETIRHKNLRLYVIDADGLARANRMGRHINRIMQTCFFALGSGLPPDAVARIKASIRKTYAKRGQAGDQTEPRRWTTPSPTCSRCGPGDRSAPRSCDGRPCPTTPRNSCGACWDR
ncbi:MAG: pyruvate:ferredoxin (flavodoxin) oxidoreductase [Dehalococcoidia bacterium]